MPNHITNVIESSEEVIQAMLDENDLVDFSLIIPYDTDLNILSDDEIGIYFCAETAAEAVCREDVSDSFILSSIKKLNDESFEQFIKMVRNKRKHGFYHFKDFAKKKWGTKWNAYEQNTDKNTKTKVIFHTAWDHPFPVVTALSKKFSDNEIRVKYASEDLGCNCGYYSIKNGINYGLFKAPDYDKQTTEDKRKWNRFAFELCYPDLQDQSKRKLNNE